VPLTDSQRRSRNFQVFDPLDFLAELTQHIPEPNKHLVLQQDTYHISSSASCK
jgi:hypothetical protein